MNPFFLVLKSLLLSMLLLAGSAFAADKVDINRADAAQLEASLVGIGPAKAQAIVEHRNANGPFKSADELNAYFASDAMVLKLRDLAERILDLGDSVKADEVQSQIKSARQDALRAGTRPARKQSRSPVASRR